MILASAENPSLALWVVVLYAGIQFVESYALTPNLMRIVIHLPQAMILAAQLLFGALFGLPGLFFAVPLALALMLTLQTWIEHRNGDHSPAEGAGA